MAVLSGTMVHELIDFIDYIEGGEFQKAVGLAVELFVTRLSRCRDLEPNLSRLTQYWHAAHHLQR